MYQKIRFIYSLLEKRTKAKIFIFALSKISLSFLDLAGVLLIGLLLAKSVGGIGLQTTNSSNISSSIFQFLNDFSLIGLAFLASFAFLARSILSALFTKYMFEILSTTEAKLATQTFRYLLENMAWTVKKYSKSDLNYMLSASIMASIQIITSGISIVSDFFFLVVILATFLFINLETTLFIIFYFGVISVILHSFLGKRFEGAGKTSLNSGIAVTTIIYDVVQSFREVTSLRRENFFLEKFNNKKLDGSRSAFYVQYLNSLPRYIVESALVIGVLGIIFISYEPGNPERSAQTIGIFLTGALRILSSLLPLQTTMANYRHLLALSEKYLEFENLTQSNKKITPSTLTSAKGSREKFAQPIGIKVEDLSFAYIDSTSPALKGLNFSIKPGDLVAFIGPSGSGKSTLADILIGINKPSMGKIDYFSEETKNLQIDNFRVGYVPQTPGKIYGNIKENIAFGLDSQDVDSRLLARAIDISNLNELIRNLELGYETHLGEQTDSLSGGQMQRIGLARALYIDPNLLVLDEATSALDIESEYAITESLNEIRGKCTIVVIAHRLSTVQKADVVFVMNEGQIVASGKFSELATKNEMVAKYIELSDLNAI